MKGKQMTKRVKHCDNKSVGLIVESPEGILLIERAKYPFGFACPAGHVDDHGTWLQAAINELEEEVGLEVRDAHLVHEQRYDNQCRRNGGTYHDWRVYKVTVEYGPVRQSQDETKSFLWADSARMKSLSNRTFRYRTGDISEEEWEKDPGIEPIWYDLFQEIGIIS